MDYVTVKYVSAEPEQKDGHCGYRVYSGDESTSWCPRAAFEKASIPVADHHLLPGEIPRITQEMVDDFIVSAEAVTMGAKTTVVRAVLRNGFEIVESSSCISPEKYDETIGVAICMERITEKVWELLGFLLQTAACSE